VIYNLPNAKLSNGILLNSIFKNLQIVEFHPFKEAVLDSPPQVLGDSKVYVIVEVVVHNIVYSVNVVLQQVTLGSL
jgi:hypothetical protein